MLAEDDSYEAALRAADALFSNPRRPGPAPHEKGSPSTESPSTGEPDAVGADQDSAAAERTGRILRVIDEPPVERFTEIEAARAPKRRGRKPGSKNKPKPERLMALMESVPETPLPRPQLAAVAATPPETAARVPGGRTWRQQRYAWVRTTLRPGEQWKRRLPKVIW